jgi:hypothetical protein
LNMADEAQARPDNDVAILRQSGSTA